MLLILSHTHHQISVPRIITYTINHFQVTNKSLCFEICCALMGERRTECFFGRSPRKVRYCCTLNKKYMLLCRALTKISDGWYGGGCSERQRSQNALCHLELLPGVISWWFCESVPFSGRRKRRTWEAEPQMRLLQSNLNRTTISGCLCLSCFHTGLSGPFESQSPGGKGNVCTPLLGPPQAAKAV